MIQEYIVIRVSVSLPLLFECSIEKLVGQLKFSLCKHTKTIWVCVLEINDVILFF